MDGTFTAAIDTGKGNFRANVQVPGSFGQELWPMRHVQLCLKRCFGTCLLSADVLPEWHRDAPLCLPYAS